MSEREYQTFPIFEDETKSLYSTDELAITRELNQSPITNEERITLSLNRVAEQNPDTNTNNQRSIQLPAMITIHTSSENNFNSEEQFETNTSSKRISSKENKTEKSKTNIALLPKEILSKIIEFSGVRDLHNLSLTSKTAAIIRNLSLDLSDRELNIEDIWRYFGNNVWNITGLKIIICRFNFEQKATDNLPEYLYSRLKNLILQVNSFNEELDLSWLSFCTNLNKFNTQICCNIMNQLKVIPSILTPLKECKRLISLNIDEGCNSSIIPLFINFSYLEHLSYYNNSITNLDFLENNKNLISLDLYPAEELKDISGLKFCSKLQKFKIIYSASVEDFMILEDKYELRELALNLRAVKNLYPNLSALTNLNKLELWNANSLKWICNMSSVTSLTFGKLKVIDFSVFSHFPNLIILKLLDGNHKSLSGIEFCTQLTSLEIVSYSFLKNIDNLNCRDTLRELSISRCKLLENLNILKGYPLTKLALINLPALFPEELHTPMSFLSETMTLQSLHLSILRINSLDGISSNTGLKTLSINKCHKLNILDGISGCIHLENITIDNCYGLRRIVSLQKMQFLTKLSIGCGTVLPNYNFLMGQPSLKNLELDLGDIGADNITLINNITTLETLYLSGGINKNFLKFDKLSNLRHLSLANNETLIYASSFTYFTQLQSLKLISMEKYSDMKSIGCCTNLEELTLSSCPRLTSLVGLDECTRLSVLRINECRKMEDHGTLYTLANHLQEVEITNTSIFTNAIQRAEFRAKYKNWEIGYCLPDSELGPKIKYKS